MSLLKNRLLPLRTITLRYIARNLELFWKKKWDPELLKITKASDDILLNLPSVIRLEIFLYYCKTRFMHIKTLLLLLDHRTFSEELDELRRLRLDRLKQELDTRYVMTLLARRCKESTSLVLDAWSFFGDPSFGEVLGTFTELTSLRLYTTNSAIVKVIGTSLHNLEQLYLDDLMHDNFDDIKYLVTGCPQLRILHCSNMAY